MAQQNKIHIIAPYPRGEAPSQRFRFEQYLDFIEANGFEICFHSFHTVKSWNRLYQKGKFGLKILDVLLNFARRKVLLFRLIRAKHIFMHREMAHIGPPIFEWILAKIFRKKFIYDFDDAIWLPNYSKSNALFQRLKAYWKVKYIIKWADRITVGNDYLKNFALQYNTNVTVIPTTIDTENHHNRTTNYDSSPIVIGWTGTHSTMHYLDELVPIIQELEKTYDFIFRVISNKKPDYELKSLDYLDWKKETEIEDLAKFNIGVMPLVEDDWSQGKCGFKALQYMSLGIPTVLSPVGVNIQIVTNEVNGFLCVTPSEWKDALVQLLEDKALRKKIGSEGRNTIIEKYSVLAFQEKYLALFN
jgi:glycosyltransferase involved in cell wall biosynthesis